MPEVRAMGEVCWPRIKQILDDSVARWERGTGAKASFEGQSQRKSQMGDQGTTRHERTV